jgi:hypothetical protein
VAKIYYDLIKDQVARYRGGMVAEYNPLAVSVFNFLKRFPNDVPLWAQSFEEKKKLFLEFPRENHLWFTISHRGKLAFDAPKYQLFRLEREIVPDFRDEDCLVERVYGVEGTTLTLIRVSTVVVGRDEVTGQPDGTLHLICGYAGMARQPEFQKIRDKTLRQLFIHGLSINNHDQDWAVITGLEK